MSQQGPILVITDEPNPALADTLGQFKVFPLIETGWDDADDAIARVRPAAILAGAIGPNERTLRDLSRRIGAMQPYTPLIAIEPDGELPSHVIAFKQSGRQPKHLIARLNAALRVRTMHATLLRRLENSPSSRTPDTDPLQEATVLLIGRGGGYPALSVALGARAGVIGALSIEAAAKHLNARDIDGIVIGEGFSGRVLDAFLTVLSEDARFRNLPVILATPAGTLADYDLPNLEISSAEPTAVVACAVPLIRQHAFEARIQRALKSIDAGGLLDPRTGLLSTAAFERDFRSAVMDTLARGGGFSVARISLDAAPERTQFDAARILSRLMRRMDFATLDDSGAIVIVLAETGLRTAHLVARRLTSVLKHTVLSPHQERLDMQVSLATLLPNDTPQSLLGRLMPESQRAAS